MFKFAITDNTNLALDPPDMFVRIKIKREYHATMSTIIVRLEYRSRRLMASLPPCV